MAVLDFQLSDPMRCMFLLGIQLDVLVYMYLMAFARPCDCEMSSFWCYYIWHPPLRRILGKTPVLSSGVMSMIDWSVCALFCHCFCSFVVQIQIMRHASPWFEHRANFFKAHQTRTRSFLGVQTIVSFPLIRIFFGGCTVAAAHLNESISLWPSVLVLS